MPHALIELTRWPSMPVPMQCVDEGEAWIWGDFVATLQKEPISVSQMMHVTVEKKRPSTGQAIEYPYAMSVFYKKFTNPHGPSSRPILCVAIERQDYAAAAALMEKLTGAATNIPRSGKGPLMVGMFEAEGRTNLGDFSELVTADSARTLFFNLIRERLHPEGSPARIGTIQAVFGHPETGWPAQTSKKSGCFAAALALAAVVLGPILWLLIS